jgi:hypothetical protein
MVSVSSHLKQVASAAMPDLEGLILGPDSAVEDLESCLFHLGREQGQGQYFIRIKKGVPPR